MHMRLHAELAHRLAAESSLSYPDYVVLVALTDQPDGRLRPYRLAQDIGWEQSRLSHHVARMTERGLVERVACPSDRRGAFVAVTAAGRREIEAAAPGHVADVRELFIDRLTGEELDVIARVSERVLDTPPLAGND